MKPEKRDDGFYYHDGKKIVGRKITDAQDRIKWLYSIDHESGTMKLVVHFDYTDEFDRWEAGGEHVDGPLTAQWIYEGEDNPIVTHREHMARIIAKKEQAK